MKTLKISFFSFIVFLTPHAQAENGSLKVDDSGELEVRALTELNQKGKADCYPFVSEDGLRLYYTQQVNNVDRIMIATRSSVDTEFEKPKELKNINKKSLDCLAPFLLNDEKEILFMRRTSTENSTTSLWIASRASQDKNFGTPHEITLQGEISGFLSGPSMTADKSQLFIYNNNNENKESILQFNKIDEFTYVLVAKLNTPETADLSPGKITSDGLRITFSCGIDGKRNVYAFKRATINESFGNPMLLESESQAINTEGIHQVYPSNNGLYMVFTTSQNNRWQENDLYIASVPQKESTTEDTTIIAIAKEDPIIEVDPMMEELLNLAALRENEAMVEEQNETADESSTTDAFMAMEDPTTALKIFPNPTVFQFNVTSDGFEALPIGQLVVYNTMGQICKVVQVTENTTQISVDVSDLKSGVYIVQLQTASVVLEAGRLVVEK